MFYEAGISQNRLQIGKMLIGISSAFKSHWGGRCFFTFVGVDKVHVEHWVESDQFSTPVPVPKFESLIINWLDYYYSMIYNIINFP